MKKDKKKANSIYNEMDLYDISVKMYDCNNDIYIGTEHLLNKFHDFMKEKENITDKSFKSKQKAVLFQKATTGRAIIKFGQRYFIITKSTDGIEQFLEIKKANKQLLSQIRKAGTFPVIDKKTKSSKTKKSNVYSNDLVDPCTVNTDDKKADRPTYGLLDKRNYCLDKSVATNKSHNDIVNPAADLPRINYSTFVLDVIHSLSKSTLRQAIKVRLSKSKTKLRMNSGDWTFTFSAPSDISISAYNSEYGSHALKTSEVKNNMIKYEIPLFAFIETLLTDVSDIIKSGTCSDDPFIAPILFALIEDCNLFKNYYSSNKFRLICRCDNAKIKFTDIIKKYNCGFNRYDINMYFEQKIYVPFTFD